MHSASSVGSGLDSVILLSPTFFRIGYVGVTICFCPGRSLMLCHSRLFNCFFFSGVYMTVRMNDRTANQDGTCC